MPERAYLSFFVKAISKAFLGTACRVHVNGLERFVSLVERKKGLITYSNHISVLDDPLTWGVMPLRNCLDKRTVRTTLGASDICFTNPLFTAFFSAGQTIETHRGAGIYQHAIDVAIEKLNAGHWLHIYPEGYVGQTSPTTGKLRRFKWGLARLLLEANHALPHEQGVEIVPIFIQGFEKVMPEERGFPRFLPRLGQRITITFGEPVTQLVRPLIELEDLSTGKVVKQITLQTTDSQEGSLAIEDRAGVRGRPRPPLYKREDPTLPDRRSKLVAVLQDALESLGARTLPEA
ncbi:uncharacterized protein L969DRAFT_85147 [Mixia osmundae IAM 14324]|uniref:Tafazzin family protein n=1 Tax=Mixia osmundae (strain CBS 9802 / IAM 14324 / JCM 22182 / KY 12970) TaxID=764103 RepID=G7DY09_MIXOS|nr:uncharacterized protein L969DRAFT_85147 [Mixia osmundae IAM 14324]KEI41369.1 hypothetical protein L969DRAFT_85147 [Mixia osmundae IAM 14324]GAA95469.1 hypothetical protein E5Q_02123 [Mixia osmundae IAM 14324]